MYYVQPTYLHVGKSNNEKAQQMSFLSNTVQSTPILQFRVRPRFFDQVGHETMYASSGNKHSFTKSCHRQTYQNYEQPPGTYQNSHFQSHFSVLKIGQIFPKKFSIKNIRLGDQHVLKNVFENFDF